MSLMKQLIFILFLTITYTTESYLKRAQGFDGRIVGGEPVLIENYPYQVSVMYIDSHMCGGSLISASHVLTAAHCTYGISSNLLLVRAGSSLLEQGGQVLTVAKILQHEQYNKDTQDFDLAILRLNQKFNLDNTIQIVSLPIQNFEVPDEVLGTATGWGRLEEAGPLPVELQKVELPTINNTQCKDIYNRMELEITERMFCAGFLEGKKDTCDGDSGGPFVINGELVGITSWGVICAGENMPAVYTKVSYFTDYLKSVLDNF